MKQHPKCILGSSLPEQRSLPATPQQWEGQRHFRGWSGRNPWRGHLGWNLNEEPARPALGAAGQQNPREPQGGGGLEWGEDLVI